MNAAESFLASLTRRIDEEFGTGLAAVAAANSERDAKALATELGIHRRSLLAEGFTVRGAESIVAAIVATAHTAAAAELAESEAARTARD